MYHSEAIFYEQNEKFTDLLTESRDFWEHNFVFLVSCVMGYT